jgi:hypothetical protein
VAEPVKRRGIGPPSFDFGSAAGNVWAFMISVLSQGMILAFHAAYSSRVRKWMSVLGVA